MPLELNNIMFNMEGTDITKDEIKKELEYKFKNPDLIL